MKLLDIMYTYDEAKTLVFAILITLNLFYLIVIILRSIIWISSQRIQIRFKFMKYVFWSESHISTFLATGVCLTLDAIFIFGWVTSFIITLL